MSNDVGGFGSSINIIATTTFPAGFTMTQFSDDTDAFDIPPVQNADDAMGANGDLVVWSTPKPIEMTVSAIPGSDDDKNLQTLYEANRVGRGKSIVRDKITMTVIYPDGSKNLYSGGFIKSGMPGQSLASTGKLKSKTYVFVFENVTSS